MGKIKQISTFHMPTMDVPITLQSQTNISKNTCLFMWRVHEDGTEYLNYAFVTDQGYVNELVFKLPINFCVLFLLISVYQKIPTIKPLRFPDIEMYTCEKHDTSIMFTATNDADGTVIGIADEGSVVNFTKMATYHNFILNEADRQNFSNVVERIFLRTLNIKMKIIGRSFTLSRSSAKMTPTRKKLLETYASPDHV